MDKNEACQIIENIRDSLINDPNQFNITVKVTGQQFSSSGGIGAVISTKGGAPGSTTIGNLVSMNGAKIEILKKKGNQALNDQFTALVDSLNEIVTQLKNKNPNKNIITNIINSMKKSWVPNIITSVLSFLVKKIIGL